MNNILVTGSNKGIGYGIFKYLMKNNIGKEYFFSCRNLEKGKISLNNLEKQNLENKKKFHLLQLDLEEKKTFQNLFSELKGKKIDLLINNAAINNYEDKNLEKNKQVLKVNFENTQNFIEEIKNADILNENSLILNITTNYSKSSVIKNKELKQKIKNIENLKDIENIKNQYIDNYPASENFYPNKWPCKTYSFSKLLLNYYTKLLSKDQYIVDKNIQVYTVHPGWVKTDMGGSNAPKDVEYGVESVLAPIYFEREIGDLQGEILFFGKKDMKL